MSTSVTWNGTVYSIPASGELNWSVLSNFLIDLGQHAALSTAGVRTIRVATTSPVTVAATTDYTIVCKLSVAGAVTVNLPAGVAGQIFVIHDGTGDASSNNITITPNGAETINGAATRVISHNRGTVTIQYSTTGTDWKVIDEFYPSGTIVSGDITGQIAVAKGGTNLASGTSGGILGFTGSTTIASSALLTQHGVMIGGGAAATPTALGVGTNGQLLVGVSSSDPAWGNTVSAATTFSGQLIGKGTTTNDDAAAGYIGEYMSNVRTSSTTPNVTSGQWFSVDSATVTYNDGAEIGIVLTPGDWDVSGSVIFIGASGTTCSTANIGIGTAKGNDSSGITNALNGAEVDASFSATARVTLHTPVWRTTVASGTTTYYLKANSTFAVSTLSCKGVLRARRVR